MIIYNKGEQSDYLIFDRKLSKKIKTSLQPGSKGTFSHILFEKINGMYFYGSKSIKSHYKRFKHFLSFEKYMKEILFIEDEMIRNIISDNRKKLRVKKLNIFDSMAVFNYITHYHTYKEYGDELTRLLEENYDLL